MIIKILREMTAYMLGVDAKAPATARASVVPAKDRMDVTVGQEAGRAER